MNHQNIAHALCGHYTEVDQSHGYLQSFLTFPNDGTLLGAHILKMGNGRIRITDDGDTVFHAAAAGGVVNSSHLASYRKCANELGVELGSGGELSVDCAEGDAPLYIAALVRAADRIATLSVKHRPKDSDRFASVVEAALVAEFGKRVIKNFEVQGISGHQLRFPFAISKGDRSPILITPIGTRDDKIHWGSIYEAGGKFLDVKGANEELRRVAVMEHTTDRALGQARNFLGSAADVIVYSTPTELRLALAA